MICFPAHDLHQFFNIVLYKICVACIYNYIYVYNSIHIYIYTHLCICKDVCMCVRMLSFLFMIDAARIDMDWEKSIDYRLL